MPIQIDGAVCKKVTVVTKPIEDGAKLVAQVVIEFEPTETGLARLAELLRIQEQTVTVRIETDQIPLPMASGGRK